MAPADSVSGESSLSGSKTAIFFLCSHMMGKTEQIENKMEDKSNTIIALNEFKYSC